MTLTLFRLHEAKQGGARRRRQARGPSGAIDADQLHLELGQRLAVAPHQLQRSPRGRMVTGPGYRYLGLAEPSRDAAQLDLLSAAESA